MTAEMMYPVSADATSDPPHPVGQQICRDDHPGEAQQYEQIKRHVSTSFAVTRSTKRQRKSAVTTPDVSGGFGFDTKRGSGLIGERDRGQKLLPRHPRAGLGEQHKASELLVLVFNTEADLLAREPQRVESPPDPAPAHVAIAFDCRADSVGQRRIKPAVPQPKHVLKLRGDRGDNIMRSPSGREHLGDRLDSSQAVA